MTTETEAPKRVFAAIAAVMGELNAVAKDGYNQKQKYKFRSIEAVCNALHPLLAKFKLFFVPEVLGEPAVTDGVNEKGTKWIHVVLRVKYTFYSAEDGSSFVAVVPGQAVDYGDKACNKAMSFAEKLALSQVFCIPTADIAPDGDADSPSMGGRAPSGSQHLPASNGGKPPFTEPKKPSQLDKDKQAFIEECAAMSARDCKGWVLSREDCGKLYLQGRMLCGNPEATVAEVTTWMREQATLGLVVDTDSGEVLGAELKAKETTEAA